MVSKESIATFILQSVFNLFLLLVNSINYKMENIKNMFENDFFVTCQQMSRSLVYIVFLSKALIFKVSRKRLSQSYKKGKTSFFRCHDHDFYPCGLSFSINKK